MRKGDDGEKKQGKKIMMKIVATNVVASRPPNGGPTGMPTTRANNPLSPGGRGPKDPQLSKSLNALKWVHKNGWNVFDFSFIDLKKISNQKF